MTPRHATWRTVAVRLLHCYSLSSFKERLDDLRILQEESDYRRSCFACIASCQSMLLTCTHNAAVDHDVFRGMCARREDSQGRPVYPLLRSQVNILHFSSRFHVHIKTQSSLTFPIDFHLTYRDPDAADCLGQSVIEGPTAAFQAKTLRQSNACERSAGLDIQIVDVSESSYVAPSRTTDRIQSRSLAPCFSKGY